jgi:hypothetical protein
VDRSTLWEQDETYLVLDESDSVSLNSIGPANNAGERPTKTPKRPK